MTRTAQSLLRLNQRGGFDCPGCAWPESDKKRKAAEFCENGAKAVAEENTLRTVGAEFWAKHSVDELSTKTEYWLGNQGRLSEPMVIRAGETHYSPLSWADAFELIGEHVRASTPDRCVFYTSGRTANETVFMYQLYARALGTNNLPDCSNMRPARRPDQAHVLVAHAIDLFGRQDVLVNNAGIAAVWEKTSENSDTPLEGGASTTVACQL